MIEGVPLASTVGRSLAARQARHDQRRLHESQLQMNAANGDALNAAGGQFVDEDGRECAMSDTAQAGQKIQTCDGCGGPVDMAAIPRGGPAGCPHCGAPMVRQVSDDNLDADSLDDSDALDDGLTADGSSDAEALESLDSKVMRTKRDLPSRNADGSPFVLRDNADRYFSLTERKQLGRLLDDILARRRGQTPLL